MAYLKERVAGTGLQSAQIPLQKRQQRPFEIQVTEPGTRPAGGQDHQEDERYTGTRNSDDQIMKMLVQFRLVVIHFSQTSGIKHVNFNHSHFRLN